MALHSSSDIIHSVQRTQINGQALELLILENGKVLAIGNNSLAFYQNINALNNPLGAGLINLANLEEISFDLNTPLVMEHRSGYVALRNGYVLIIFPNAVRLYSSNECALSGKDALCELPLN